MSAKAIPVLMYHHVSPNPGLVTVSPTTFEDQMARLAGEGWRTLTADQFSDYLTGRHAAHEKSLLITFDDGYLDNYVYAYPALRKHGLHAVLFAVTGWIGDGPARAHAGGSGELPECPDHKGCKAAIREGGADRVMLRWTEIKEMETAGAFEIQSHTHTHTRWDQQRASGDSRVAALEQDLARSREVLRQRLGREPRHLAWPQGYYEPAYLPVARRLGFEALYTTKRRINRPGTPLKAIGRIVVKDQPGNWLPRRLFIYSRPFLARCYMALRGSE